jgi:hypothetical protein
VEIRKGCAVPHIVRSVHGTQIGFASQVHSSAQSSDYGSLYFPTMGIAVEPPCYQQRIISATRLPRMAIAFSDARDTVLTGLRGDDGGSDERDGSTR